VSWFRALVLSCCVSPVGLAQHEGHGTPGSPSPARIDFDGYLRYSAQGSLRGARAIRLSDWESFQGDYGRLRFSAMTSVGSFVKGDDGTPSLLQTGGTYRHGYVHDREHRREVIMEAAAELRLDGPGSSGIRLYVAPVGSPALGPPAYMHRPSANGDPAAPVGHHWQDATHASHGVASVTFAAPRVSISASAFNARESDFESPWPDLAGAELDSYAGRLLLDLWPVSVSGWWGYLKSHDPIAPAMQMHRYGAAASLRSRGLRGGAWSSMAAWGMNVHHHDGSSHLLLHGDPDASPHVFSSSGLIESSLEIGESAVVFARAERVVKNGEELGFLGGDLMAQYAIGSLSLGANRTVGRAGIAAVAAGFRTSLSILPSSLESAYGTRTPAGLEIFIRARPGR
jgi:hypothetical protein